VTHTNTHIIEERKQITKKRKEMCETHKHTNIHTKLKKQDKKQEASKDNEAS
jgi:hypothetical protein